MLATSFRFGVLCALLTCTEINLYNDAATNAAVQHWSPPDIKMSNFVGMRYSNKNKSTMLATAAGHGVIPQFGHHVKTGLPAQVSFSGLGLEGFYFVFLSQSTGLNILWVFGLQVENRSESLNLQERDGIPVLCIFRAKGL